MITTCDDRLKELDTELEEALGRLKEAFTGHTLRPGFASRCSPIGDRRELARRLESGERDVRDLAVYCFKAMLSMGDEEDFLALLPDMFVALGREAEWHHHDTFLFERVRRAGYTNWPLHQQAAITDCLLRVWARALADFPWLKPASLLVGDCSAGLVPEEQLVRVIEETDTLTCARHVAEMRIYARLEDGELSRWLWSDVAQEKLERGRSATNDPEVLQELEVAIEWTRDDSGH